MNQENQFKVFIVEDDQDLCQAWSRLLEIKGYNFVIHRNSEEALADKGGLASCDIFITDYYLPDSNGIELAKKLRPAVDVPFILLTGSKDETLIREAQAVENFHIVYKPIRFQALENEIKKLLGV